MSRTIRRNADWVPALGIALSFLLIVGQTLNCCRFNESLSASVAQVLKSLVRIDAPGAEESAPPTPHGGCHGHSLLAQAEPASQPLPTGGPGLRTDEACLSEVAMHPTALQPVSTSDIGLLAPGLLPYPALSLPRPSALAQPRPQNKSSPPVYLLTLRLLV